jgi:CheY-like chemotaxis protein
MGLGLSALDREVDLLDEELGVVSDDADERTPEPPQERLGGARADFVANLGRRVAELSLLLRQIEPEPDAPRPRDDLRRRLHALAAGARLLRFARLAEELAAVEAMLHAAAERGRVAPHEIAAMRTLLDRAQSLAWGDTTGADPSPAPPRISGPAPKSPAALASVRVPLGPAPAEDAPSLPITVLVVGPSAVAEALDLTGELEVESTSDNTTAIDLARALAPDVVVIDTDRPGARELLLALAADPLTELVPLVALGRWSKPEEGIAWAALGVARALPKPVSPDVLRRACLEIAAAHIQRSTEARPPLGEVTLDELGARLNEELRRGLSDAAVASGKSTRFDLGEGAEVLAALWGAVARIRDLVTIQSHGDVRFAPSGPEGALPLAPWLGDGTQGPGGRAPRPTDPRGASEVSLAQKTIVVADDDPAVTWFLAGVLQAAGAIVYEAHDGARALEIAFRVTPDLLVSDVLMPGIDGFAVCRALKRDVVLRDVPVILLSWKEDLLQRVRELGADADGYLRKEATASAILTRVREVMRARHRVAERLAAGGEVRGRLEGLTSRTLLGLACAHRPASIVSVRDAAFLYEVEIRGGRPVRATRTSLDGASDRGAAVLGALIGVGAGRFVVAPPPPRALPAELEGTLDDLLMPSIAAARAAQRLLSGAALVSIERVDLAEDRMSAYLAATPEPARSLLRTLAAGASPRALVTSGQAAPRLIEDVLCDAAAHGAITAVAGIDGDELLEAAIEEELSILRGTRPRPPVTAPPLDLGPIVQTSTPAPVQLALGDPAESSRPSPAIDRESAPPIFPEISLPDLPSPAASSAMDDRAPSPSIVTLGSLTPPPVQAAPPARSAIPKAPPAPVIITAAEETPSRLARRPSSFATPSAPEAPAKKEPAKDNRGMWALFAVAGIVFAVGARLSRDREIAAAVPPPPPAAAEAPKPAEAAAPAPAETVAPAPEEPRGSPGESKSNPILPTELPLRAEDNVPPGQGMLEITAGTSDTIYIDATLVGNGPIVKRALAPRKDPYEIRVKLRGEERVRFVLVKEARLTKVRISPPWAR